LYAKKVDHHRVNKWQLPMVLAAGIGLGISSAGFHQRSDGT
jgi:hypothetical protein